MKQHINAPRREETRVWFGWCDEEEMYEVRETTRLVGVVELLLQEEKR